MDFFSTRSRRLRQKIQELQLSLADAERAGAFIREQGVAFAALEDMGEESLVIMQDDLHAEEELEVIRAFFNRNGFTVEELRFDFLRKGISELEIIPPNEMLVAMARVMQAEGFRIVDDTEGGAPPFDMLARVCPLSQMARAVSLLFARRVQRIIAGSRVRRTREGNRLLSWMPAIVQALSRKVNNDVRIALEFYFDEAFDHFYARADETASGRRSRLQARLDQVERNPGFDIFSVDHLVDSLKQPAQDPYAAQPREEAPLPAAAFMKLPPGDDDLQPVTQSGLSEPTGPVTVDASVLERLRRGDRLARTLAGIYRGLIRARPRHAVRNASAILDQAIRLLDGAGACLLASSDGGKTVAMFAQAGDPLAWAPGPNSTARAVSRKLVRESAKTRAAAEGAVEDLQGYSAVVVPVLRGEDLLGLVYMDRTPRYSAFSPEDVKVFTRLAKVFQEFPDLTLNSG